MQPKTTYPRWFHTFRGFVLGLALGCIAMAIAHESQWVVVGNALWKQIYFPLILNSFPWMVLALFEIYFGVRHYHALRREMDGRAGAA